MKKRIIAVVFSAFVLLSALLLTSAANANGGAKDAYTDTEKVSGLNQSDFADKINSAMPYDRNYMFSPASIKYALALAANGADGETKTEILNAVGITDIEAFNRYAKETEKRLSQDKNSKVRIANSIWINGERTNQRFTRRYAEKVFEFFGAVPARVNNKNALRKINGWVKNKTDGKIKEIISSPNFDAILLNAVYFKGEWADEFSESDTILDTFTDRNRKKTDIDFMNKIDRLDYLNAGGVECVSLPYRGGNMSMYLIKTDKRIDVEKFISANRNGFVKTEMKLSVPKFKIEYSADVKKLLEGLGIKRAFTDNAQFENMFDYGSMKIDNVLHKTYIDVNEKGTEAAAVTAVVMNCTSVAPSEELTELKFDSPFAFAVRDNVSGEILFMGEYAFAE